MRLMWSIWSLQADFVANVDSLTALSKHTGDGTCSRSRNGWAKKSSNEILANGSLWSNANRRSWQSGLTLAPSGSCTRKKQNFQWLIRTQAKYCCILHGFQSLHVRVTMIFFNKCSTFGNNDRPKNYSTLDFMSMAEYYMFVSWVELYRRFCTFNA